MIYSTKEHKLNKLASHPFHSNGLTSLSLGSGVYMFQYDQVVDVILQNANVLSDIANEIHPWHLHGHDFWVLGYGEGKFKVGDERKFNLKNPPLKNTIVIFPYGLIALRFKADNPGVWAFHCHIKPHLRMEMSIVFAEVIHKVNNIFKQARTCGVLKNMFMNNKHN
ncbi:hypothetical protein Fmac_030811 [Flemingia macrophylla]|uniref:Plastocyanin-like domain-containing protein n=1 Tax=Flemingia macrophylla TaxID=520843 RepID=A0ABD1L083_9FABA